MTAGGDIHFDAVVLATPLDVTQALLRPLGERRPHGRLAAPTGQLGHRSGACLRTRPSGPHAHPAPVLVLWFPRLSVAKAGPRTSCWPAPSCIKSFPAARREGAALLRAFFGGESGEALLGEADDSLVERARLQLSRVFGPLPEASETVVRRWPQSLPQYSVGHLDGWRSSNRYWAQCPGFTWWAARITEWDCPISSVRVGPQPVCSNGRTRVAV